MSIILSDDITLSMMRNGIDGKDGKDGKDGIDGEAGKSAYQIWLDAGNTGSEDDYLESLKGANGQDGAPGKDGENGKDGADGQNAVIYTLEIDNPARRYAVTSKTQGSNKINTITYTISPMSLGIQFFEIDGTSKNVYTPEADDVTVIYSTREQVSNSISGYLSGPTNNKYSFNLNSFYTNVIINVLTNLDSIDISIDGLISFYEGTNLLGSFEIKDAQPDEALKHLITSANIQTSIDNNSMVFDTNGLTLYNGAFKIVSATISNGQISSPTDLFYYDTTNTSLYIKTSYARIGGWCIGGAGYDNTSLYSADKKIWLSPTGIAITSSVAGATVDTSLVFKAGSNFGVDTSGKLYASNASLTGKVNATSGSIGSGTKKWEIGSSTDDSYIYTGISSIDPTKDANDTGEGIYIGTDGIRMRTKIGTSSYQNLIINDGKILFTDIYDNSYNGLSTTYGQNGLEVILGNLETEMFIRGKDAVSLALSSGSSTNFINFISFSETESSFYPNPGWSCTIDLGAEDSRWNNIYGTTLDISSTSTFAGKLNANGSISTTLISATGTVSAKDFSATGTVSAKDFSATGEVGSGSVDTGSIFTDTITVTTSASIPKFTTAATFEKSLTLSLSTTPTHQNQIPAITWQTFNDHTPYFGYDNATQVDGTFVWSLDGGDYMTGLAIGGGTGNLLWKGKVVATTDMIPTYGVVSTSANGLAPKRDGDTSKFLRGDGNWAVPPDTKYTLPTASSSTLGGVKTTSSVTSTSGLTACPIISGVPYYKDTNTTYSDATISASGLMSAADKTKLNGFGSASEYLLKTGGTISGSLKIDSNLIVSGTASITGNLATSSTASFGGEVTANKGISTTILAASNYVSATTILAPGGVTTVTSNLKFRSELSDENEKIIWAGQQFYPTENATSAQLGKSAAAYHWKYGFIDNIYVTKINDSPVGSSDRRLKKNIISLSDIHSQLFDKLKPVQYKFIDLDDRIYYGLIAQDIEVSMIELGIETDALGLVRHKYYIDEESNKLIDKYSVDYNNLIAMLIYEVQKLKKQIAVLEQA